MKVLFSTLMLVITMALATTSARAEEYPFIPELPFETAVIHYQSSGMREGTGTLYVKGEYRALEKNEATNMMGMKGPEERSLTITTPDYTYYIDYTAKTAMRSPNPVAIMKREWEKMNDEERKNVMQNMEKFGNTMALGMGGSVENGTGEFLGYKADVITVMGTKTYTLSESDILLKSESNIAGMTMSEVATSIEKNVPVSDDRFKIPEGLAVTDNPMDTGEMGAKMFRAMAKEDFNPEAMMQEQMSMEMNMPAGKGAAPAMQMPDMSQMPKNMPEGMPDMKDIEKMMKQYGGMNSPQ